MKTVLSLLLQYAGLRLTCHKLHIALIIWSVKQSLHHIVDQFLMNNFTPGAQWTLSLLIPRQLTYMQVFIVKDVKEIIAVIDK